MPLEYTVEIVIEKPRDAVIALFRDPGNMKKWMPDLVSFEPLEGALEAPGSKSRLVFQTKGRKMEMVETVLTADFPDRFAATYECGKVVNHVDNTFTDTPEGHTRWVAHNIFILGGFMRLLGIFMKRAFPKQSRSYLEKFKAFAEEKA